MKPWKLGHSDVIWEWHKSIVYAQTNQEQFKFEQHFLPFNSESYVLTTATEAVGIKIQKTIFLPAVLYGYETWHVTYREEHMLSAIENNAGE
jgi:hypothetical protein